MMAANTPTDMETSTIKNNRQAERGFSIIISLLLFKSATIDASFSLERHCSGALWAPFRSALGGHRPPLQLPTN